MRFLAIRSTSCNAFGVLGEFELLLLEALVEILGLGLTAGQPILDRRDLAGLRFAGGPVRVQLRLGTRASSLRASVSSASIAYVCSCSCGVRCFAVAPSRRTAPETRR